MHKRVSFAVIQNQPRECLSSTDCITLDIKEERNSSLFGEYRYESEPIFGSSEEAHGEFVLQDDGLFGIVKTSDRPKADSIFRTLNQDGSFSVRAPQYSASSSHQFYNTYGFNGYTTSFRENLRTYDLNAEFRYIEPEEKARKRAMHKNRTRMSDDLVDKMADELIRDEYYVSSMDMALSEDGPNARFSNPLEIGGIKQDEWNKEVFGLVIKRANELWKDEVKTTEEVLCD
jgi:hypothetical protein